MERPSTRRISGNWGWASLLAFALSFPALSQMGPYPGGYPGGGYPGGGYPGIGGGIGGIGLPIPHRGKKNKDKAAKQAQEPLENVTGILRQLDEKSIVVEAQDTRIISMKRSDRTKFFNDAKEAKPSDFHPGDHVQIGATQDEEGFLYAVNVILEKPGTAAERAAASQPADISTQASENDEERPTLRHKDASGKPETEQPSAAASPSTGSSSAPAPSSPGAVAQAPPSASPSASPSPAGAQAPSSARAAEPPRPVPQRVETPPEDPDAPHLRRGWSKVYKPLENDSEPPPREVAAARIPATPDPARPSGRQPAAPPSATPSAGPEPVPVGAPAAAPAPASASASSDPIIERARLAAASFTKTLPNYVCQEMMARFVNTSHIVNWQPLDIVSTEVVYESGRERYRNVAVNGKVTNKRIEDLPGSWSTGEFGSVLVDLFSASTAADFTFRGESTSGGQAALVYDFDVDQDNSHWHVQVASQAVLPAYSGSVWIDKITHRVLRVEMQARHLPQEFPIDKIESATDYQYIYLGDKQFLLPVHAESLSCQRGTSLCSRNVIDFRNYHKYSADSEIIFGK